MQLKKIAIVFLVVIMMFSLAAIGIAAEEAEKTELKATVSAKIEVENSYSPTDIVIKPGTVFNYVISVEASAPFVIIDVLVQYDCEALEFVSILPGDLTEEVTPADTGKPDQINPQCWTVGTGKTSGVFCTIQFKVKDTFDGDIEKLDIINDPEAMIGDVDKCFECTVEDAPKVAVHDLDAGKPEAGTCKNVGTTTYKCTHEGCDYELVLHNGVLGDHNKIKQDRIEPTEDREGCEEHYRCDTCGKLFDAEGKELSSYPSIPKLEKTKNNTAVTVIIIVVAVVVVAAGAAAAVVVLKKKKII